jgi:glutathione S-transferase
MALTIYGSPRSRALRVLWMATELDLEFEHVPVAWDDPALKSPEFLRINPAGAIPAIVDDGFALGESLAINLYLAKKHGARAQAPLYPATLAGEADAWRWSLWAQQHLEPWVQRDALWAEARAALGQHARTAVARALGVLEHVLAERAWLLASGPRASGERTVASVSAEASPWASVDLRGAHFTVADLNRRALALARRASRAGGVPTRARLARALLRAARGDRREKSLHRGFGARSDFVASGFPRQAA